MSTTVDQVQYSAYIHMRRLFCNDSELIKCGDVGMATGKMRDTGWDAVPDAQPTVSKH